MAFPIDPGRPPGTQPLEDQVPNRVWGGLISKRKNPCFCRNAQADVGRSEFFDLHLLVGFFHNMCSIHFQLHTGECFRASLSAMREALQVSRLFLNGRKVRGNLTEGGQREAEGGQREDEGQREDRATPRAGQKDRGRRERGEGGLRIEG